MTFTSATEVMFSSAPVSLFVCLLAGLRKNYLTDFHIIWWKGGIWATEETIRFWWWCRSDHVKLGLGLGTRVRWGNRLTLHGWIRVTRCVQRATSVALAAVYALLSASL